MREIEHSGRPANIIGIDLGTSDTCVARFNPLGIPEVTYNCAGEPFTPSVIRFFDGFEADIGYEAKKFLGLGYDDVFAEFKRDIGSEKSWKIDDETVTPTDLTAMLLKKVVSDYSAQFGKPGKIAITWPANFRQEQREATKMAALSAGLENVCFVEESIAAALGYARETCLNGYYLVYDLGGGTFEATLIKATDGCIAVINSAGVQQLGGKDFDNALLKLIAEKFRLKTGEEFDRVECCFTDLDLLSAKHTLSTRPSVLIRLVSCKLGPISLEVSRAEFENSISHFIAQAEMACEDALCSLRDRIHQNVKTTDIKEILMVGDTCRTPAIQDSILRIFGKKPVIRNPSQVVAMGAAIFAALKAQPKGMTPLQLKALEKIKAEPIAPYYFGTTILDHESYCLRNHVVIRKGEKLPCRISRTYFTTQDNQSSVICDMTLSSDDTSEPDFVSKIFECSLTLPASTPQGTPITVTFECDVEGCASLQISAPPEGGGGSTTASAKISPPTPPPLHDER